MKYPEIFAMMFLLLFHENINSAQKDQDLSMPYKQANDLVGEWQLTLSFYDANGNYKIEDAEKKNATPNAKDYLKLNGDGTCLFYTNKLKGRYEIKTRSSGKRNLYIFDKDNNKENRGEIVSVSKTELILLSPGGTFSIYKKT